jgi:hypothetical protein
MRPAAVTLLVGAACCTPKDPGPSYQPAPFVSACPDAPWPGGDECHGMPGDQPPEEERDIIGDATAGIGDEADACTCVENGPGDLEAACASIGYETGCPTLDEAYDNPVPGSTRWAPFAVCDAVDGSDWEVIFEPYSTGWPYNAQPFLYFPNPGAANRKLEAISLLPLDDETWCCNRTTVTQRWLGKPLDLRSCRSTNQDPTE